MSKLTFHLRILTSKLSKDFDYEMQTDYQKVTSRQWTNPIHNNQTRKDIHNLTTKSAWQYQLKELITQIKAKVDNIADFLKQLEQYGVTVTERKRGNAWTYHQAVNTKTGCRELKIRDFYRRVDKKSGEIKTTHGLGQSFSKAAIEDYFNKKKENEKEHYSDGRRESDGIERIKTLTEDARARTRRQRRINQIAQQQLKEAVNEEKRKASKRKTRLSDQKQRQTRGTKRISRQATKPKRQGRPKQSRRPREVEGPEL